MVRVFERATVAPMNRATVSVSSVVRLPPPPSRISTRPVKSSTARTFKRSVVQLFHGVAGREAAATSGRVASSIAAPRMVLVRSCFKKASSPSEPVYP